MNELVVAKKNKIYAESQVVSSVFDKRHDNVLRDIKELQGKCSDEFWQLNFEESEYKVRGKRYPCFNLTRDGFTMLAMGFTGAEAIRFKELYINRFNEMERMLTSRALAKLEFPALTGNIESMHNPAMSYHYSNESNMINTIVLGMNAKQFRTQHGITDKESIRPYLNEQQISDILELQRIDTGFVLAIPDYYERKKMLETYYNKKRKLLTD